jgi:hypothetical protein
MRPPEIGPGGGYDMTAAPAADHRMYLSISACSDNSDCAMSTCCTEHSSSPCDSSCSGNSTDPECRPSNKPGCGGNSNCPQNSHNESGPGNYASAASGLSDEVVAQLKQHLRDRVGMELLN